MLEGFSLGHGSERGLKYTKHIHTGNIMYTNRKQMPWYTHLRVLPFQNGANRFRNVANPFQNVMILVRTLQPVPKTQRSVPKTFLSVSEPLRSYFTDVVTVSF